MEGALLVFESKKDGDYHQEMNSENFENWFKAMIEKLPQNAVIVMDNASYHSRKVEKIPTLNTKKEDIIGWLKGKNIIHEENLLKRELLDIVKIHRKQFDAYVIDEFAKTKNMTVLRLPPYHCELNPIELIWAQVKGDVAAKNTTFKLRELKELFSAAVQKISPEKWKKCVKHVIEVVEPQMNQMDHNYENLTESFIINVNDSCSDTSSQESD